MSFGFGTNRRSTFHFYCGRMVLFAMLAFAGTVQAGSNDQTVVVGAGLGVHTYAGSDDVRKSNPFVSELKDAAAGEAFLEWYALGTVGIGLRAISLGSSRTYNSPGIQVTQNVNVDMQFVTLNWVPVGAASYARLGLLAGAGSAQYKDSVSISGQPNTSATSNGSASLLGIYLDWGGDGFGARFGVHSIKTALPDLTFSGSTVKNKVDASGTTAYFDLRWAW